MKQLLIIASLLISLNASAADFTDAEKRHFENQCKDIMSDIMVTLNEKHPNPRAIKMESVIDRILAAFNPLNWLQVSSFIEDQLGTKERFEWPILKEQWPHEFLAFRWSEDRRTLVIVGSVWGKDYFDKVDKGQTLKGETIAVGAFTNIRITPTDAELVDSRTITDFPAFYKDKIEVYPHQEWFPFKPYTSHKGARSVNWNLWLDPDEMSPPFHGWFTWHERNQLLALDERWPNLGLDFNEYMQSPEERHPKYYNGAEVEGDATLEVRTTRRKKYVELDLEGQIQFDSKFLVYTNLKRFNSATLSYRTRSYLYNECDLSFDDTFQLLEWLEENGSRYDEAYKTINKPWNQRIAMEYATEYSGTRERFFENVRHVSPRDPWQ